VQKLLFVLLCSIAISVFAKEEDIGKSLKEVYKTVLSPLSSPFRHNQELQFSAFQRFLATRGETERDFLNPSGMYFHWQLGESRHGFPHAAHTMHIVSRGWFRNVEVPEPFHLPINRDAYCEMLEANGPSLVVELSQSDVTKCFSQNDDSNYRRVNAGTDSTATDLWIFERIP
jgi:hypothetical protein